MMANTWLDAKTEIVEVTGSKWLVGALEFYHEENQNSN